MTTKLSLSDSDVQDLLQCLRNEMDDIKQALGNSTVSDMSSDPHKFVLMRKLVSTVRLYDYINSKYQVS